MKARIIEISIQTRVSDDNLVSQVNVHKEIAVCESPTDAWRIAHLLSVQIPSMQYQVHHEANGRVLTYVGGELLSDVFPKSDMDYEDDEPAENDCGD